MKNNTTFYCVLLKTVGFMKLIYSKIVFPNLYFYNFTLKIVKRLFWNS